MNAGQRVSHQKSSIPDQIDIYAGDTQSLSSQFNCSHILCQGNSSDDIDLNRKHKNIFENSTEVFEPISLHLGCKLAESSSKTDELLSNMNLQKVDQSNYNDKGTSCALKYSNVQPAHKVTKICKRSLKDVDEFFESLVETSRGVLKSKQVYTKTTNDRNNTLMSRAKTNSSFKKEIVDELEKKNTEINNSIQILEKGACATQSVKNEVQNQITTLKEDLKRTQSDRENKQEVLKEYVAATNTKTTNERNNTLMFLEKRFVVHFPFKMTLKYFSIYS